jgi:hypothetical protein
MVIPFIRLEVFKRIVHPETIRLFVVEQFFERIEWSLSHLRHAFNGEQTRRTFLHELPNRVSQR